MHLYLDTKKTDTEGSLGASWLALLNQETVKFGDSLSQNRREDVRDDCWSMDDVEFWHSDTCSSTNTINNNTFLQNG